MDRDPTDARPAPDPERLFEEFLEGARTGTSPDLEALCARYPPQAESLRRQHRDWQRAGRVLQRLGLDSDSHAARSAAAQAELSSDDERLRAELLWGRYTVQGEIGRGGMGSILSVRDEGLGRDLAMKVMRGRSALAQLAGGSSEDPEREARFREEARITGRLEHPGIVPVHELGSDPEGRPYFTMKLVGGRTFKQILALVRDGREGWNVQRALGVLLKVCEAVGFAHDKGVVHRDLKPANLMIGSFGEVYVMDWGLARDQERPEIPVGARSDSTDGDGPDDELDAPTDYYTREGDVLGTPEYMSPEQASGQPERVGPLSDVFALGAMLYELLTGEPPLGVRGERSPHVRLAAALGRESRPVRVVAPDTPAELCSICERALAPDPVDRYPDMIELADDLRAYLEGRVVKAHATGAWAEAKKWVLRNRAVASLAASLIAMAGIGLVVVSGLAVRISNQKADIEEQRSDLQQAYGDLEIKTGEATDNLALALQREGEANEEREKAQRRTEELEVVSYFQNTMLSTIDAEWMGAGLIADLRAELAAVLERDGAAAAESEELLASLDRLTARVNSTNLALGILDENILSRAVETIERDFAERPELDAMLRETVGVTYHTLGLYEQARPQLERSYELRRELFGDGHPHTNIVLSHLAKLLKGSGELEQALEAQSKAWEALNAEGEEWEVDALIALTRRADALQAMGRYEKALDDYDFVLESYRRLLGDEDPKSIRVLNSVGICLRSLGKLDEAEGPLREALDLRLLVLGPEHTETLSSLSGVGALLHELGRPAEAEVYIRRAYEGRRARLGDDHPVTVSTLGNLAYVVEDQGRLADAEPLHREALERGRRVLGEGHPSTLTSMANLSALLKALGHKQEAFELAVQALEGRLEVLGDDHDATFSSLINVGHWYEAEGQLEQADDHYHRAYEGLLRKFGEDHPQTMIVMNNRATLLSSMGRLKDAEQLHLRVLELRREKFGDDHPGTLTSLNNLGALMQQMGRYEDSLDYLQQALEGLRLRYGGAHPNSLSALWNVASILLLLERPEEAEPYWDEAVRAIREAVPPGSPVLLEYLRAHGDCLVLLERFSEAETLFLEEWEIVTGDSPQPEAERKTSIAGMLSLYQEWHAAEPEAGYDAKAEEWRAKL